MRTWAPFLSLLLAVLLLAGCQGVQQGASPAPTPPPQPPITPPAGGGGGAAVRAAVPVAVGAGTVTAGVDIEVTAPAGAQPNIEVLGFSAPGEPGVARNTGTRVRRGASGRVILFGTNLSPDQQVSISGPPDITISNVRSIESTAGRLGIAFDVQVSGGAAVGGRTVFVRNASDDVSAFAGGLEVLP